MEYEESRGFTPRFAPGPDDCEDLESYQNGGYHPVLIGDEFCDGKYSVVHKLGAGAAATVWLAVARTGQHSRYVALKILAAYASSPDNNELKVHEHLLRQKAQEGHTVSSVASLLDSFWVEGPNGKHLCLAFEVSGPSLGSLRLNWALRKIRPDVMRNLALQSARGLQELHDLGVVYGDVSPNNILFRLVDIDSWTIDELYERLGHPDPWEVQTSGGPVPACAPKVVYKSIQFHELSLDLLRPEIMFIDLADGHLVESSQPGNATGYSIGYAAPETLWFKELQSQASDVWSLACIWFEMRSTTQLFEESSGAEYAIQDQIIDAIGPLPSSWVERLQEDEIPEEAEGEIEGRPPSDTDIEAQSPRPESTHSLRLRLQQVLNWFRSLFFGVQQPAMAPEPVPEDDRPPIPDYFQPRDSEDEDQSLPAKVQNIGKWQEWHYLSLKERVRRLKEFYEGWPDTDDKVTISNVDHEPPPGPLSEEERADFEDLLSSILKYEKEERRPLKDIVNHPWLHKAYGDVGSDPWLKKYHEGVELRVYYM